VSGDCCPSRIVIFLYYQMTWFGIQKPWLNSNDSVVYTRSADAYLLLCAAGAIPARGEWRLLPQPDRDLGPHPRLPATGVISITYKANLTSFLSFRYS
jgi:hypothetical protein